MPSEFDADTLVQLVHRYYPSGLEKEEPRYEESEESQRLNMVLRLHEKRTPDWEGFVQRLRAEFTDCFHWDTTIPRADPCYSYRLSLPGFVMGSPRYDSVVCLLSQLAPVYALYASHTDRSKPPEGEAWLRFPPFPAEFQPHEERLAGLIESMFGFTRLSNEVLFTSVPDVVPRTVNCRLGEAKLIDCLLTEHRF